MFPACSAARNAYLTWNSRSYSITHSTRPGCCWTENEHGIILSVKRIISFEKNCCSFFSFYDILDWVRVLLHFDALLHFQGNPYMTGCYKQLDHIYFSGISSFCHILHGLLLLHADCLTIDDKAGVLNLKVHWSVCLYDQKVEKQCEMGDRVPIVTSKLIIIIQFSSSPPHVPPYSVLFLWPTTLLFGPINIVSRGSRELFST